MSLEERVAVLETKLDTALLQLETVEENTSAIKESMSKQRGFIAGILAVITPIWGVILYVGKEFLDIFLSK